MKHFTKQKPTEETKSLFSDGRIIGLVLWGGLTALLAFPPKPFWPLVFLLPAPAWAYAVGVCPRKGFMGGWACGLGFFCCLLWWLVPTMVDYGGLHPVLALLCLIFLAAYLGLFQALTAAAVSTVSKKNKSLALVLAPLAWTGLEHLRGVALTGIPWGDLPQALWRARPALDLAPYVGIDGVRLLVASAALAPAWFAVKFIRGQRVSVWTLALPAAAAVAWLGAGLAPSPVPPPEGEFSAALIQGNIDQSVKWDPWFRESALNAYFELTRKAAAENPDLALALWPETSVPFFVQEPGKAQERIKALARELNISLVFGAPAYTLDYSEPKSLNSVFLVDATGECLGRYDKVHLVPFGEYVPLGRLLSFVDKLVEGAGDFVPGGELITLKPGNSYPTLGPLICFEAIFPDLASQYSGKGAQVLAVVTNDGWFGDTPGPYQHLAFSAWRAAELGLPLVRAANTGISAAFDSRGKLLASTKIQTDAALVVRISYPPPHETPQNLIRPWIPWLCLGLAAAIVFVTLSGRIDDRTS